MRARPGTKSAFRRAVALFALTLCACWFPKDRGQRLEERLDRVEDTTTTQPNVDRAAAQEQARRVDAKLAEMQTKLNELSAALQQAQADRPARSDKLPDDVNRLRAMVDALGRRLEGTEQAIAQLRSNTGSRLAEHKTAHPTEHRVHSQEETAVTAAPAPREAAPAPQEPTGVLAMARDEESKGQKAVARDLYQEYVEKFPTDPKAATAHFRLGELAFGEHRYVDAIGEYGKVAKDFPRSDEAPDALLRTAESMLAINMTDDAVSVLADVPKRYPSSPAAARAKQRLTELKETAGKK